MNLITAFKSLFKKKPAPSYRARMIILVGLPAAGKSTYAESLPKDWLIINQDKLGSRHACLSVAKAGLLAGMTVVIDRCNVNRSQRQIWTNLARQYRVPIQAVVFNAKPEVCIERAVRRSGHVNLGTQTHPKKVAAVISAFHKSYEEPHVSEGFASISYSLPYPISNEG